MHTRSRKVEMPNGLSLGLFAVELAFGMNTLLMGSGRYVLLPERKRQFAEPPRHAVRLDIREVLTVRARCALVGVALVQAWARMSSRLILSYSA